MKRSVIASSFVLLLCGFSVAFGQDLYLTDATHFPGALWLSREGRAERVAHRRDVQPLSSAPGMIPRLAQVCVLPGGKQFFCSGLDGYVFHNLNGHEVVSGDHKMQVRDLAPGENDHTYYFSTVATPQNNERLADGRIYRHDVWEGGPRLVATVKQDLVGNDWWGAFAVKGEDYYIATLRSPVRVYRLQGAEAELKWESTEHRITGMTFDGDHLLFASGGKEIYRLRDFHDLDVVLRTERNMSDVAAPGRN